MGSRVLGREPSGWLQGFKVQMLSGFQVLAFRVFGRRLDGCGV